MVRNALLAVVHAAVALAIVGALFARYEERRREVAADRVKAEAERADTQRLEQEMRVQQDLLRGIRDGDPYVVEMLARDKLRYQRAGEITPPPRPAVDSSAAPGTK